MSTWLYLVCEDHTPPLIAEGESGQHLYDLPQIREDIANREAIAQADIDYRDHHFRVNTAKFLKQHLTCLIAIEDEYGERHDTTPTSPAPAGHDRKAEA